MKPNATTGHPQYALVGLPSSIDVNVQSQHSQGLQTDSVVRAMHFLETQASDIASLRAHQEQMRNELHAYFQTQLALSARDELNSQAHQLAEARFLQLMEACIHRMEGVIGATASLCAERHVPQLLHRMAIYVDNLLDESKGKMREELSLQAAASIDALAKDVESRLALRVNSFIQVAQDEVVGRVDKLFAVLSEQTLMEMKTDLQSGLQRYADELLIEMKGNIESSVQATLLASLQADLDNATSATRGTIDVKLLEMLKQAEEKHAHFINALEARSQRAADDLERDLAKRVENVMRKAAHRQNAAYQEMETEAREQIAALESEVIVKVEEACLEGRQRTSSEMMEAVRRLLDDPQSMLDSQLDKKIASACANCEQRTITIVRQDIQRLVEEIRTTRLQPGVEPNRETVAKVEVKKESGHKQVAQPVVKERPEGNSIAGATLSTTTSTCPLMTKTVATGIADVATAPHCTATGVLRVIEARPMQRTHATVATQTDVAEAEGAKEILFQHQAEREWRAASERRKTDLAARAREENLLGWLEQLSVDDSNSSVVCGIGIGEVKVILLSLERYVDTGVSVKEYIDTVLSQLPKLLKTRIKTRLQLLPPITTRIEFAKLVVREVGGISN